MSPCLSDVREIRGWIVSWMICADDSKEAWPTVAAVPATKAGKKGFAFRSGARPEHHTPAHEKEGRLSTQPDVPHYMVFDDALLHFFRCIQTGFLVHGLCYIA